MTNQKLYDVYISYPPGVKPELVNECIRENLTVQEADELIQALSEHRQAIIAEHCTNEERINAQHYFSYLDLDVIVRRSLELLPNQDADEQENLNPPIPQCPVCYTILDSSEVLTCPTCHIHLKGSSEAFIYRKRIEWQERVAFEERKQHEIAYKLLKEKQDEEKRLRKKIRTELENELMHELGMSNDWRSLLYTRRTTLIIILAIFLLVALLAVGYLLAQVLIAQATAVRP